MIRVVFTVDAPFLGGAEHYVARLATGLDRLRFAPAVVMRSNDVDESLLAWAAELESSGIPVSRVRMRLPFRPGDAVPIYRALAAFDPDVVHVNMPGPYSAQMGLLAPLARLAGARVVVTEHLPMVPRLWKRDVVKRIGVGFVDAAVTMTRANAELLVRRQGFPRRRVRVIENGVPASFGTRMGDSNARAELGIEAGVVAFVFVGNLIEHKGLRRVIEALSRLAAAWRLVVAGAGPDADPARDLAARLGVTERVVFLGRCSSEHVERVMAAGDVLVLPSAVEGLPYVILEAMACGKPVVSSRVFGIPEAVMEGETGLLVAPDDVAGLAEALRMLAADPALRERMGRAGRDRFERHFTLERQIRAMSSLYRELVTGRRAEDGP
ncbi:MAG TPA: glycosyltransferase family 4 protein [Candidatus Krumholzibacteria bacterium]|nr:glycosyltransferase family 4 protein [Candidatus Krumholzibacteria bacterium]